MVARDDIYAIAVVGISTGRPDFGYARIVRIDARSGEMTRTSPSGRVSPSACFATATEEDTVWIAMHRDSRNVSVLKLGRDGAIRADHEIELEGRVGFRAVAALSVDSDSVRLAVVQSVISARSTVELIRLDRQGAVVERHRAQLPERAYPNAVHWAGEQVVVSTQVEQRGPVLHRFAYLRDWWYPAPPRATRPFGLPLRIAIKVPLG